MRKETKRDTKESDNVIIIVHYCMQRYDATMIITIENRENWNTSITHLVIQKTMGKINYVSTHSIIGTTDNLTNVKATSIGFHSVVECIKIFSSCRSFVCSVQISLVQIIKTKTKQRN